METHRYAYDKSVLGHRALKFSCPQCNKKRYVRFYDFEANEYMPEQFGKCDREDSCGYVETPWDWLKAKGVSNAEQVRVRRVWIEPAQRILVKEVDQSIVRGTMRSYRANNLYLYLEGLYGTDVADYLVAKYFIGTAKGNGTIFWQVDRYMRVRTAQKIHYKMDGHRDKDIMPPSLRLFTLDLGYVPCLFGEHLIWESKKDAVIGLVESEKTAVIASLYYPQYQGREMIWLATTGMHGGYTEGKIAALEGRTVVLCPDFSFGARAYWGMVKMRKTDGKVDEEGEIVEGFVSYADKLRENKVQVKFWEGYEEIRDGTDLADYLVNELPKSLIKEPEWDSLYLVGNGNGIAEESRDKTMSKNVEYTPNRTQEIDRMIREKYGYGVSSRIYDEAVIKLTGQLRILQDPRVELLINRFDLAPNLKF